MEDRRLLSTTPMMLIGNATVAEGDVGLTPMVFTVRLTSPSTRAVTVNYRTVDRTATAGEDYLAAAGQIRFSPGQTSQTITVNVIGNTDVQPDRTLRVVLSGATNARLVQSIGVGTILDDDTPIDPELSINSVAMARGLSGHRWMDFTIRLNTAVDRPVAVTASTRNLTAIAGLDYAAKTETLTFLPGETAKTFSVRINGTSTPTPDRIFYVDLSTTSGIPLAVRTGVGVLRYGA